MKTRIMTKRLALRELTEDDLDTVAAMLGDPEVMRFWPKPCDRAESLAWIERQLERYRTDGYGYWLAVGRDSGEVIGQAGLLQTDIDGLSFPALGYIVNRRFWRRGYATEAARACVRYVFEVLDQPSVHTLIRPENEPSLGVAAKLGMTVERRLPYAGFDHFLLSRERGGDR